MNQCQFGYFCIGLETLQFIPSTRRIFKRPIDAAQDDIPPPSRIFNLKRICIMKTSTTASIVLALAALSAGQAMAAEASTVRAGGDVVESATGQKLSDLFPALYGKTSSKTRAEVSAQVEQTVSNSGDVIEPTTGLKLSALNPAAYATQTVASVGTRAEVRAQAVQALQARNAGDVVEPTTGQKLNVLFASRYNGKAYN